MKLQQEEQKNNIKDLSMKANNRKTIDLQTYKAMMEEIVNGQLEIESGITLDNETVENAKRQLAKIAELEKNNSQ